MDFLLVAAAITIFLLFALAVSQWMAARKQQQQHVVLREELARKTTENEFFSEQLAKLEPQLEMAKRELAEAKQAEQLARQKLEHAEQYKQEREKDRGEFEKAARNSVMTVAQEVSSKLLADHKREAEQVKETYKKEKQEENQKIKEYLSQLNERFSKSEQLTMDTRRQNDILWRTFSSPSSTGRLAEVGLENLLKNMGLIAGSDYSMQYTVGSGEGSGLRPDCVIKLPNNRLVVIDCKASKHVLAIAEAKDSENEEAQNQKFLATMKEHLKALARKDYVTAIQQESFINKKEISASQITNVMYLPSSAAVERLYSLDPDLIDKSEKQGIILIGPGQLHGLISLVSKEISDERKLENQERIIHEVEKLLGALASTFGHISKVGSGIQSLTTNFSKISGSFNRLVAPKLRNLEAFGIKPAGSTKMPAQLESFELRSLNDMIEVTAESEEEIASLEDFRGRKESA